MVSTSIISLHIHFSPVCPQRKVKFPFEFDVLAEDMVTEELRKKIAPVNGRLREVERERLERKKVRRRTKQAQKDKEGDVEMGDASKTDAPAPVPETKVLQAGDLPDEKEARAKEAAELNALVDPTVKEDVGANVTGMYELCGTRSREVHLSHALTNLVS